MRARRGRNSSAYQLAEKVVEVAESTPEALKRGQIFNDFNGTTEVVPFPNLARVRVFPQVVKCVRENLCRPSGTPSDLPLHPGLTSWANLLRPSGAGVWQILFHRCHAQSSSHASEAEANYERS